MSRLPVGTLLRCVSVDHADVPFNYEILIDDIVIVASQDGDKKHFGDTTMLSLMTGVFYRVEYGSDSRYEAMDDTYEMFTP